MNDLSLKGVARKYAGIMGGLSVASDIFGVASISGSESLRTKLETMAREEHSFTMSECIYSWTAAFEQVWTHITIRIRLNPDAGIPGATMTALQQTWENGIENSWTHRWGCGRSVELTCRLSFDVQWVAAGQHHTVRVRPGPARSNMLLWDTADTGAVAAHEFGHMTGLVDEYPDANCPDRDPVNTETVMHNNSNTVPSRLMTRFAYNIGSHVVAI